MPYDTKERFNEGRDYIMLTRKNALNKWLQHYFGDTDFRMHPLTGDASFRAYFRLHRGAKTWIIMDAPPEKETIDSFLIIAALLMKQGIHAPMIYTVDTANGFILLEDLGNTLLFNQLSVNTVDTLYADAIRLLLQIQTCSVAKLPVFNHQFIQNELELFHHWFLTIHLKLELTPTEEQLLRTSFNWLGLELLKQPKIFVHRDYHSRNLMIADNDLAVIDFQDAMQGPFTYDLVSLLKDCYIKWPRQQVIKWVSLYYEQMPQQHDWSLVAFTKAFDLCGLQRHLKVLGIFCRLHWRDNKSRYLDDLPLVIEYVKEALEREAALFAFYTFFKQRVIPAFLETCGA